MVQIRTQPPEVAPQDVNTLLGSFQREGQGLVGALAEGVTAGVRTYEAGKRTEQELRPGTEIDPELFDALIGVNVSEYEQLQRGLGKEAKRQQQTGKSRASNMIAYIRQARANNLPPEVIEHTVRSATGTSVFGIEQLIDNGGKDPAQEQRDMLMQVLKENDELFTTEGTFVGDLNDAELVQWASKVEQDNNSLQYAERNHSLLLAQEGVTFEQLKENYRTEVIPKEIGRIDRKIQSYLNTNKDLFPTEQLTVNGLRQTRLRVDQMNPEAIEAMRSDLRFMREEARKGMLAKLAFRGSAAEREEIMDMYNFYFDEAERVLTGEGVIENLTNINNLAEGIAKDGFYRNNPGAREAVTVSGELGKIVNQLGLEGLEVTQQLAEVLFLPLTKGVVVNAYDHFKGAGIDNEAELKQMFRVLADYVNNPNNDMTIKGTALRNLLPKILSSGVEQADIYDSMLGMMADPQGFQVVLDSMDNIQKTQVREYVRNGFVNYREEFQQEFENALAKRLSSTIVTKPNDPLSNDPSIAETFKALSPNLVPLSEFVDENLFNDTAVELNLHNLDDLTEAQKRQVINAYTSVRAEFIDRLDMLSAIQKNYFDAQERAGMNNPDKFFGRDKERQAQEKVAKE